MNDFHYSRLGVSKILIQTKICTAVLSSLFSGLFFYFLFNVETEVSCFAIDGNDQPVTKDTQGAIDVSSKFKTLFTLFAVMFLIDVVKDLLTIVQIQAGLSFFSSLISFLKLNALVQLAAVIWVHLWRLDHVGRVCSGDFLPDEQKNTQDYLISRGEIFWIYLMLIWIIFGLITCCCFCTICFKIVMK